MAPIKAGPRLLLKIADARFPGKTAPSFTFGLRIAESGDEWRLWVSPGAWLPGWATGERSAALGLFMQDKEPVAFPLRQAQAEDLRRQIFGDRIETVAGINACFTCRGA